MSIADRCKRLGRLIGAPSWVDSRPSKGELRTTYSLQQYKLLGNLGSAEACEYHPVCLGLGTMGASEAAITSVWLLC